MKKYDYILFDLDDTLVDNLENVRYAYKKMVEHVGEEYTEEANCHDKMRDEICVFHAKFTDNWSMNKTIKECNCICHSGDEKTKIKASIRFI